MEQARENQLLQERSKMKREIIKRLEKLCERPSINGTAVEKELWRIVEMIKKELNENQ